MFLQSCWANKVPKVDCQNDLELWLSDPESMGNLRVVLPQDKSMKHKCPRWQQSQNLAKYGIQAYTCTCILTPPRPQWAYDGIEVWATRRWTYIALYFEYFETTRNLDIALDMSSRGNNWQMDWWTDKRDGQTIQLHIINAPANLSGRRIKTSLFRANKYSG